MHAGLLGAAAASRPLAGRDAAVGGRFLRGRPGAGSTQRPVPQRLDGAHRRRDGSGAPDAPQGGQTRPLPLKIGEIEKMIKFNGIAGSRVGFVSREPRPEMPIRGYYLAWIIPLSELVSFGKVDLARRQVVESSIRVDSAVSTFAYIVVIGRTFF